MSTDNRIPLTLDLTGTSISNKIVSETCTVMGTTTKYLVLDHGGFFTESLVLKDGATTLLENVDYIPVVYIEEISSRTLKEVTLAIVLLTNVTDTLVVSYQAVGDVYDLYREPLIDHLSTLDFSQHTIERNAPLGTELLFDDLELGETTTTFLDLVATLKELETLYIGLDNASMETLNRANLDIQAVKDELTNIEAGINDLENNISDFITPTKDLYNIQNLDNHPTFDETRYLEPELPNNERLTLGGLWNLFAKRYVESGPSIQSPMVGRYAADLSTLSHLPKHIPRLTKDDQTIPHDPNPQTTLNFDGRIYFRKIVVNGVELPSTMNNLTIDGQLVYDTDTKQKVSPETINFVKNKFTGISIDGNTVNNLNDEQYTNPLNILNKHYNRLSHDLNIKNYDPSTNIIQLYTMNEVEQTTLDTDRFKEALGVSNMDIRAEYVYGNISKVITDPVKYANIASPHSSIVTNQYDFTFKYLDKSVNLNYLGLNVQTKLFDIYNLLLKVPNVKKIKDTYVIDYPNDLFVGANELMCAKQVKIRKGMLDTSNFISSEVDLVNPSFKALLNTEPTLYFESTDEYYIIDFIGTDIHLYI